MSAKNSTCGSPLSVLLRLDDQQPHGAADGELGQFKKTAVIYNIHDSVRSKTTTKNRKFILRGDTINRGDVAYPVNNGRSGLYSKIIHRAIDELDKCIAAWGRVLVLRFDLHHKGVTRPDNKWLSRLFQNLKRRIERAYSLCDVGYVWVREHERGKSLHYHAALFVNGGMVRHPSRLREMISSTWAAINPINHVYYPANQFYFIDSEQVKADVVYRLSYLAKCRGKGYRDKQVKDFFCSNLRAPR